MTRDSTPSTTPSLYEELNQGAETMRVEDLHGLLAAQNQEIAELRQQRSVQPTVRPTRRWRLGPQQVAVIAAFLTLIGSCVAGATAYLSAIETARETVVVAVCNNASAILLDETPSPGLTQQQRGMMLTNALKIMQDCARRVKQ